MRLGLAATWLLSAVSLGFSIRAFPWDTMEPERSAYASAVLAMLGFQWVLLIILLVTAGIGLLWVFGKPEDQRGHSVIHNVRLLAAFTGLSAAIVFAIVYVSPRL
jgi:heme/copper-type cytochrome/quinol oxidase subunit 2